MNTQIKNGHFVWVSVYRGKKITFFAKQKRKCVILRYSLCSAMSDRLLHICIYVYRGEEITALPVTKLMSKKVTVTASYIR